MLQKGFPVKNDLFSFGTCFKILRNVTQKRFLDCQRTKGTLERYICRAEKQKSQEFGNVKVLIKLN
jgi:hypothetical protein